MRIAFNMLSDEEIERIHSGCLHILETVGVRINHDEVLPVLSERGASVDRQKRIVKFPGDLVEESLKKTPREFVLGARDGENDAALKYGGEIYGRPISGCEGYIDLETGKYRKAQMPDLYEWIRLADGLDNIGICTGVYPEGIPLGTRDLRVLQALLENTSKHVSIQPYSKENMRYMIEMLAAVSTDKEELKRRPRMSIISSPLSPLQFSRESIDVLLLAGEHGIPVEICTMANAGATAPVTLAGTLQLICAETLATIVLAETINPGAPVHADVRPLVLDMSSGLALLGAIETAMLEGALTQFLGRCWGIPTDSRGGGSDALTVDGQSMEETVLHTVFSCFSGASILGSMGNLEGAYTASPLQIVIDDEIHGICQRALKGIEITDETLALDPIGDVGPGGNFLAHDHTLKYFRSEFLSPSIVNRMARQSWEAAGSRDLRENAKQKAKSILKKRASPLVDTSVSKELSSIVTRAEEKK